MTEAPQLFDARGNFTPADRAAVESMTPERVALYNNLCDAASAAVLADGDLADASERVRLAAEKLDEINKRMPPPMSFHDLWKATFKRN
jgi:hypothetical protein